MSWSIELNTQRPVSRRTLRTALLKIEAIGEDDEPETGEFGGVKFGHWTCAVDVHLPEGNEIRLSGAGFSADDAEDFAQDLAVALRKLHHKVSVGAFRD
jgi:hypothetical protein